MYYLLTIKRIITFGVFQLLLAHQVYSQIYAVGNEDGFSVGCHTQTQPFDYDIYSVGNNNISDFYCLDSTWLGDLALSIESISLKAEIEGNLVKLNWETTNEANIDYYIVQKSKSGINWEEVASVKNTGNKNYNTFDRNPYSGYSYYRLIHVLYNGNYRYSNIEKVFIDKNSISKVSIRPNPANNIITIEIDDDFQLEMYDAFGRLVYSSNLSHENKQVNTSNLTNGIYHILLQNEDKIINQKIVIKH